MRLDVVLRRSRDHRSGSPDRGLAAVPAVHRSTPVSSVSAARCASVGAARQRPAAERAATTLVEPLAVQAEHPHRRPGDTEAVLGTSSAARSRRSGSPGPSYATSSLVLARRRPARTGSRRRRRPRRPPRSTPRPGATLSHPPCSRSSASRRSPATRRRGSCRSSATCLQRRREVRDVDHVAEQPVEGRARRPRTARRPRRRRTVAVRGERSMSPSSPNVSPAAERPQDHALLARLGRPPR